MKVKPCTLKQANELVARLHRHHKPVRGHRFSLALYDGERFVGAVICGRPVARGCDPYLTLEITRCVTDGTRNAISKLYGAVCQAARAMGFERVQTYTLLREGGASLRASGFRQDGITEGGLWSHTDGRPRRQDQPADRKVRWVRDFTAMVKGVKT